MSETLPVITGPEPARLGVHESWIGALAALHGPALRFACKTDRLPAPGTPEWDLYLSRSEGFCADYGVIYLLVVLAAIDPDAAERAGKTLAEAWNFGDSMGEWLWQWGEEHAAGRPFTVPGFGTAAEHPNPTRRES